MTLRVAMFAFLIAAVVTLFDQGSLWHFTLDPARRLTMVAYWVLHALIIAVMINLWRSLVGSSAVTAVILHVIALFLLGSVVMGVITADGAALIQVIFRENAWGAFAIIIALLIARLIWRVIKSPGLLQDVNASPGQDESNPSWRVVFLFIATIPLGLLVWLAYIDIFWVASDFATLLLQYAVFEINPAELNLPKLRVRIATLFYNYEVYLMLAAIAAIAVVAEKLIYGQCRFGNNAAK
jgi:hypothetical protein